jgi:Zn-finger nucleic acid-binding protein
MVPEREHGVGIDVCADHGVWLDHGELETIVLKLTARAGRRRRREVERARRGGKISGALWGWWSLFSD